LKNRIAPLHLVNCVYLNQCKCLSFSDITWTSTVFFRFMYAENMKLEFLLQPKISRPRRNFVPILAVFSSRVRKIWRIHRSQCRFHVYLISSTVADITSTMLLMRWLQLRFDFDSTAVWLLMAGHQDRSDVARWPQSRWPIYLFIYLFIYLGRSAAAYNTYSLRS